MKKQWKNKFNTNYKTSVWQKKQKQNQKQKKKIKEKENQE